MASADFVLKNVDCFFYIKGCRPNRRNYRPTSQDESTMKLLSVLFLVGLAVVTAEISLVDRAKPLLDVIQELPENLQRARAGESLSEALGLPATPELESLERSIRNEFGQKIRDFLESILGSLDDLGSNVHDALKELLGSLLGKKPTQEEAEKVISLIADLQAQRSDAGKFLDLGMESSNVGAVTWYSIEERGLMDWWNKIKAWFSGVGSWISDKFDKFKNWAKDAFNKVIDAAKPIAGQIKDLAIEFLKSNWDTASIELVKQAMDFFYPHSGEIGGAVMQKLIDLARKLGLTKWENKYYLY